MKQKTALIIDDNPEFRSLMQSVAEMAGYKVITFSDPTVFLSQRQESCCQMETSPCADLILTDNQMPGMTGLEFLTTIKNNGCKLPDSKKGIISGTLSNEEINRATELGCKVFSKVASIEEMYRWLTSFSK